MYICICKAGRMVVGLPASAPAPPDAELVDLTDDPSPCGGPTEDPAPPAEPRRRRRRSGGGRGEASGQPTGQGAGKPKAKKHRQAVECKVGAAVAVEVLCTECRRNPRALKQRGLAEFFGGAGEQRGFSWGRNQAAPAGATGRCGGAEPSAAAPAPGCGAAGPSTGAGAGSVYLYIYKHIHIHTYIYIYIYIYTCIYMYGKADDGDGGDGGDDGGAAATDVDDDASDAATASDPEPTDGLVFCNRCRRAMQEPRRLLLLALLLYVLL